MKIYTSERMKRIEAAANEKGLSYLDMMERAGIACADAIYKKLSCEGKKIAVVCGKGKNGGDGFVAARRLKELGCEMISVILVGGIPSAEDSVTMFSRMPSIPVFVGEQPEAKSRIEGAEIIVDAVFGFGFKGEPDEATAQIFRAINASDAQVVSIDLPSGAECDTAKVCEDCIKADLTLAISCRKPAHVLTPAKKYCGRVIVVDIGLDNEAVSEEFFTFSDKPMPVLPARKADAHKGDFGKVLSICGSMKYPGAAVLAATGAVKIGAGLVFVAFPEKAYPAIASKLTEPVMLPLPCCEDGFLARGALEKLLPEIEKADTVLIGCGLGQTLGTASVFEEALAACKNNVVIDADGINLLSANINIPEAIKGHTVITPHPGEMARLVG
ncbi:MAG: NAD(P)H-hydrate epimerase, partial [Clostridia bacterium]|nr:NAD(P)H-hydrate epimerase [Clostridia bacterium]